MTIHGQLNCENHNVLEGGRQSCSLFPFQTETTALKTTLLQALQINSTVLMKILKVWST